MERDPNSVVYEGKVFSIKKLSNGKSKLKKPYSLVRSGINDIAEIIGLDEQVDLIELRLSYNRITEIKGLEHLVNLENLYLNGNRIKEIKGLDNLTNLRVLDLSSNEIVEIGGLENLTSLNDLKLEGNPIYHTLQQLFSSLTFEEILNLSRMPTEERNEILKAKEKIKVLAKKKEENEVLAKKKARNEAIIKARERAKEGDFRNTKNLLFLIAIMFVTLGFLITSYFPSLGISLIVIGIVLLFIVLVIIASREGWETCCD